MIDLVALRKGLVPRQAVCREGNAARGEKHSQCNRSEATSAEPHSVSAPRFVVFLFHHFISYLFNVSRDAVTLPMVQTFPAFDAGFAIPQAKCLPIR